MKHSFRRWSALIALCALPSLQAAVASPVLEGEIARMSAPIGGKVGVAVWKLDGKGERVLVNAGERFPMASTFKIAIAGAILADVDAGKLKLDQLIPVQHTEVVPSDGVAEVLIHPGGSLSVHNLLELMLTLSDNTATDVLTRVAGGPAKVTAWLRKQGIEDQRVDRDTAGLLRDFYDLPPGPFMQAYKAAVEKAGDKKLDLEALASKPKASFDKDPKDTSTPTAMAELLTKIFNQQALSASSTKVLVEIMERCKTGAGRLLGRMPAGTVIAHKTGTIGGTVNDVGVLSLPDNRGQLVIAVFIKESDKPFADRERVIADIARAVRDYYLFAEST